MKIELSKAEVLELRNHVREATRSLVPHRGKVAPQSASVTMSSNGAFDHYTSWDADYNGEIFVAYLCKPRPNRDKPQSADPANPEGISLGNVAGIFSHLEEQIDGFVQGMLAELAVPLSAYREF